MADAGMKPTEEPQAQEPQAQEPQDEAKEETGKDVEMKPVEGASTDGKDNEAAEEAAEPAKPEKPKEQETDAAQETRPKVAPGSVDISGHDATLNVMPTANNRVLMTLTEGGFQYLLAGVRTTVGLKSGRYMFEAKIVETHTGKGEGGGQQQQQQQGQQGRGSTQRVQVRLGLSTSGSSLLLADGSTGGVSFDSEGFFTFEKTRKRVSQRFGRDVTVALLVNLDPTSPNANTISLFRDGVRCCEPQLIPEALRGQPLYPTITYKNVTLQVNLGPVPMRPLPFTCHMLSEAAAQDVEAAAAPVAKDGKFEVLFPVGLPSTGYFDWVDSFLQQHPEFEELSDRKIVDWAVKSGMLKPKAAGHSSDKPDMKFGLPAMDDGSVRRLLSHLAPTARRNFVVPELAQNLLAADRKEALARFSPPEFSKSAVVLVGEPGADFKTKVQDLILADKKRKAELEKKRKAQEEERKRQVEERKKKAAAAKRKREGGEGAEDEEAKEEEEAKADDVEDPVVELTEEEKAMTFRKTAVPDVTEAVLAKSYAGFSLPSAAEGFDAVRFEWAAEAAAETVLKDWIFAKKLTQRVDDLQPGASFKEAWSVWQKTLSEWKKLAAEWKDPSRRKALLAKRAEAKKKEAAAKKKEAEEKGDEAPEEEPAAEKPAPVDFDELDVRAVEAVADLGDGRPLFSDFAYEDWVLLSIRFELHMLLQSFKKDLDDTDRPSFTGKDLAFYYQKYFRKNLNLKSFAVEKLADLAEMIKDVFSISEKNGFLEAALGDDADAATFVKLTEEHRRERQRRLDAGDETAELKFPRGAPQPPPNNRGQPARSGDDRRSSGRGEAQGQGYRAVVGGRPVHQPASRGPQPPARVPPPSLQQKRGHAGSASSVPAKYPRSGHYGSYSGGTSGYSGYQR